MTIKIVEHSGGGNPPGKLADAELHFTDGPLSGMKLIGFGIWERRPLRNGDGDVIERSAYNVTFPARSYSVNGERRSFSLLRPVDGVGFKGAQENIRLAIIEAWTAHVAARATA